jgi:hypothetical protein
MAPIDQVDLLTSTKVSPISSLKLLPRLEMFHYMLLNHGVTRLIGCPHHESFGVPIDDDETFYFYQELFRELAVSYSFLWVTKEL